jgi:predicted RNA-binding protein YlxR (DUF448 family)
VIKLFTFRDLARRLLARSAEPRDVEYERQAEREGQSADGKHERWYVSSGPDQRERFQLVNGMPPFRLIPFRDFEGEEVLRLCEDSTGLLIAPKNRYLPGVGVYVSQLRGEKHYVAGCEAGNFLPGSPVQLVREPENPHDVNAVAVYDESGIHRGAYVHRARARQLSKLMDRGEQLAAISIRGTAAGQRCPQIAILAAAPEFVRHLLKPRPMGAPLPAHLKERKSTSLDLS